MRKATGKECAKALGITTKAWQKRKAGEEKTYLAIGIATYLDHQEVKKEAWQKAQETKAIES